MNKKLFSIMLILFATLLSPGLAQTALVSTTTTEAVDVSENRIDITATTNVTVGDIAFIDQEAMSVNALDTTALWIEVRRGTEGTRVAKHTSGATIWIDKPERFTRGSRSGACTVGQEEPNYEPLIDVETGDKYTCINSEWTRQPVTPVLDIVGARSITAAETLVSGECGGTLFINNATGFAITLPVPTIGCFLRFIDATLLTSGNHTIVTSASANIIAGGCNELEVDTSDDGPIDANGDTITFVGTVDTLGDMIEILSDGTLWFITFCQSNLDGGFTIAGS